VVPTDPELGCERRVVGGHGGVDALADVGRDDLGRAQIQREYGPEQAGKAEGEQHLAAVRKEKAAHDAHQPDRRESVRYSAVLGFPGTGVLGSESPVLLFEQLRAGGGVEGWLPIVLSGPFRVRRWIPGGLVCRWGGLGLAGSVGLDSVFGIVRGHSGIRAPSSPRPDQ
jgi:hypothetical protein